MILRTKSYSLSRSTYMRVAFIHLLRKQWWVLLLLATPLAPLLYFGYYKWSVVVPISMLLFLLFWVVQFYAITKLEQNEIFFQKLRYQISSKEIMIVVSAKQGMPMAWKQIQSAYVGSKVCILFLSKAHFIYLPDHLFKGEQEKQFLLLLLKKHKLA